MRGGGQASGVCIGRWRNGDGDDAADGGREGGREEGERLDDG